VIVRTDAFKKVGGLSYYTSTEDIDLGIRMNAEGFRGVYVPIILVHGFAPPDFKAYSSQQYRWANGNFAIFRKNFFKILRGDFPILYQIHMFFTLAWWFVGIVTLIYVMVPLLSLFLHLGTHLAWLPSWLLVALFFNVILGISMIYVSLQSRVENEKVKFSDALLQYSLITNSSFIYAQAAFNALILGRYRGFVRTNKESKGYVSLRPILLNLMLGAICFFAAIFALYQSVLGGNIQQIRTYIPISLWLLFYSMIFISSILFVGNNSIPKKKEVSK
jgi:cellulose synthase/poly-beta-1,6-N-acetylglucosamine synthase-like glycosyltransferase